MNNYLIVRDSEDDTTTVMDFGTAGNIAYGWLCYQESVSDCVLLGGWSIDDLKVTHGNWFLGNVVVKDCKDWEPYGAGRDPYNRPDPIKHPEYWRE